MLRGLSSALTVAVAGGTCCVCVVQLGERSGVVIAADGESRSMVAESVLMVPTGRKRLFNAQEHEERPDAGC